MSHVTGRRRLTRGIGALAVFAVSFVAGLLGGGQHAVALVGSCDTASRRYFSNICHNSNSQWSGIYASWPSVPLNLTSQAASAGHFISEVIWLNDHWSSDPSFSFVEIGDTTGGGAIPGHTNEWARMWYWGHGTTTSTFASFWAYSPSDSSQHAYGFQYNATWNGWDLCIDQVCPIGYGWQNPNTFFDTRAVFGMELNNGSSGGVPFALDASANSGNFLASQIQVRSLSQVWTGLPSALMQVDRPCGTAPTCLQGWWQNATPPYDNFNNGKPAP